MYGISAHSPNRCCRGALAVRARPRYMHSHQQATCPSAWCPRRQKAKRHPRRMPKALPTKFKENIRQQSTNLELQSKNLGAQHKNAEIAQSGHARGQEYTSPPQKGRTPSSHVCRRLSPQNSEKMLGSKEQTLNSKVKKSKLTWIIPS